MSDTRWHPIERLIDKWRKSRAHTYASENADRYRGFDAGLARCADDLEAALKSLAEGQAEAAVSEAHATPTGLWLSEAEVDQVMNALESDDEQPRKAAFEMIQELSEPSIGRSRIVPLCPKCQKPMTWTATAPIMNAPMEWRCFACPVDLGQVSGAPVSEAHSTPLDLPTKVEPVGKADVVRNIAQKLAHQRDRIAAAAPDSAKQAQLDNEPVLALWEVMLYTKEVSGVDVSLRSPFTSVELECLDLAMRLGGSGDWGGPWLATVEAIKAKLALFAVAPVSEAHSLAGPGTADPLTADEWDLVLDALGTEEAIARDRQQAWKGRSRESRYQREADEAARVRAKLEAALRAAALPAAPSETPGQPT